jgi:DMSO/TMAO reductase YedYZ molybdopterin-dependent catalytic subunit
MRRLGWVLAAGLSLLPALSPAQTAGELTLLGRIAHPRTLTLAELKALPAVSVEVVSTGAKGPQKAVYTGALLWPLIDQAAPADKPPSRAYLQHTLLARGQDGYAVALAIGEIDPGFEGKQVLVGYMQDGAPLPALRLVVPGDTRAGRNVRELTAIKVR